MKCKDCGLPFTECEEHLGICCDCFDERWGMLPHQRLYLRPGASPEIVARHKKYWEMIASIKENKNK
jgi:hypothetical protein